VYNIWNTTAGGNSVFAVPGYTPGTYWPDQPAKNVFDGNLTTEYCNYGVCNITYQAKACGVETGFYLTMSSGPNILAAFYMGTGTVSWGRSRDPMLITIEGSNLNGSALTLGSSWTLIYNGTAGFITDPGREAWGAMQVLPNASIPFASYRLLVTLKQGADICADYSEVQFVFN